MDKDCNERDTVTMTPSFLPPELISFIIAHEQDDLPKLLLKQKEIAGFAPSFVADQINGRRRAKEKLPHWYSNSSIVYPPQQNLEQCSSEATAKFKTDFIKGESGVRELNSLADLTGGFGVDSFFFSKIFSSVIFVEPDPRLVQLAKESHRHLNAKNLKYQTMKAEDFLLKTKQKFDWLYVDPSRKGGEKKIISLPDSNPDVLHLLPKLLAVSDNILIKASPLLDLKQGIIQLSSTKQVIVLSVDNECKEVLFHLQKHWNGEPHIKCINLSQSGDQYFDFTFSGEAHCPVNYSEPLDFIYEPNASILKAGAFKSISKSEGLYKISTNTHLYTSQVFNEKFPGRIFKVLGDIKSNSSILKSGHANIISKNHPLTPEAIKKKFKLKDGGDKYVLAFSGTSKKFIVVADRLK
jgi:THUMP domain-like